ncbi:U-box domain-containing protein 34 [Apostasia shenzhenica]|uniref:U-box domain-containing protein 34 n=1 Tax=Apostasia shenzhenica TaxID=1088818 RepID=A0A2I0B7B5_9ASPA|nr:U-box domain-containing protein 34 [Apostasia shenzhenica]
MHTKTVSLRVFNEEEWKRIFPNQRSFQSLEGHEKLLGAVDAHNLSNISKKLENSIALSSGKVQEESIMNEKKTQILNWEEPDASPRQDGIFMPSPSRVDMKDLSPSEVVRLRLELQKTLVLYNKTCEDLVRAKKKVELLTVECSSEAKKVKEALEREAVLKKVAADERAKHLEAIKEVERARELLSRESLNRHKVESFASNLFFEKSKVLDDIVSNNRRFRRYSSYEIEAATDNFSDTMKVGEGAYGYVYKCNLDHIPVAVKVVRQDASNKREEFLREVEVLSKLNHPHMVTLLGACPERGCLVYEYMENGSLEDQLFNRKNSQTLPWFIRFRIIFEVASGLAYLHDNKPDPIVHRDLKPANILLDKHYVSKIGDVGLAKLMSDVVPDGITEYKETILAGTLYYMDPEYQRTGTVRPKSDLYALGIIAIQLLTGKQARGLVMQVENAIKDGTFPDILDSSIPDWPILEAKKLAKIALRCARLRCRDRPDLDSEVLPELEDLLNMANVCFKLRQCQVNAPNHYLCPILQELMDDPYIAADGYTYELRAIRTWLDRHKISPVTKLRLPHTNITPNHSLRAAIQEWKSHASFLMLKD